MLDILIVDDSAAMRKMVERAVRATGLQIGDICFAGDGVQALSALESRTFDLVLSDINMPNMDGVEFVRAVQARGQDGPPVVLITTETAEDARVTESLARGAVCHLKKPFTPAQMKDVLTGVLGQPVA